MAHDLPWFAPRDQQANEKSGLERWKPLEKANECWWNAPEILCHAIEAIVPGSACVPPA
jgi:hypothetical protein